MFRIGCAGYGACALWHMCCPTGSSVHSQPRLVTKRLSGYRWQVHYLVYAAPRCCACARDLPGRHVLFPLFPLRGQLVGFRIRTIGESDRLETSNSACAPGPGRRFHPSPLCGRRKPMAVPKSCLTPETLPACCCVVVNFRQKHHDHRAKFKRSGVSGGAVTAHVRVVEIL